MPVEAGYLPGRRVNGGAASLKGGLAQQARIYCNQINANRIQWQTLVERSVSPATPGRDDVGNTYSSDAYPRLWLRHAVIAGMATLLALDQR